MDELLMKYIKGETTIEERKKVIQWMDEDPSHLKHYESMRKLYTISLWSVEDNYEDVKKIKLERNIIWKTYVYEFLKIAAVFLIGILGTYLWVNKQEVKTKSNIVSVNIPVGQRAEVLLADGTKVWLNSSSTLRYPEQFEKDTRNIELDGEGYFEVAHNPQIPFIVHTNKYNIKVLGTSFNAMAYDESNSFEVSLLKGKVQIENPLTSEQILLAPN